MTDAARREQIQQKYLSRSQVKRLTAVDAIGVHSDIEFLLAALAASEAQCAALRMALEGARGLVDAAARASHLLDGFRLGDDGLPCRVDTASTSEDALLSKIDAALAPAPPPEQPSLKRDMGC